VEHAEASVRQSGSSPSASTPSTPIVAVPEHHTGKLRSGMHSFALPVALPEFTVSRLWHPRLDADGAHRRLRACIRQVCAQQLQHSAIVRGSKVLRSARVAFRTA
jgi:hypothetical protein